MERLRASRHLATSDPDTAYTIHFNLLASFINHSSCGMKLAKEVGVGSAPTRRPYVYRCQEALSGQVRFFMAAAMSDMSPLQHMISMYTV